MILIFIIIMPLLNFILVSLLGRFLGYKGTMRLTVLNILLTTGMSGFLFFLLYSTNVVYYINLGNWFSVGDFTINFSFLLDKLSSAMFIVVLFVSYCVHLFSCAYMKNDPHFSRFMSYLSLFTFFMLVLVSSDNLIVMFIGW